jgi:hypothetical protein
VLRPYDIPIFYDKNGQNNPVHGASEGQTGGSPPVGRQKTCYFYQNMPLFARLFMRHANKWGGYAQIIRKKDR